jgi:Uma2 family endonuclease
MADDIRLAQVEAQATPSPASAAPAPSGLDHQLTSAEFERMAARGAFEGLGRWELRGGRLHRMSPVHVPHARIQSKLVVALTLALEQSGSGWDVLGECTIRFEAGFSPTADIVVAREPSDAQGFAPGSQVVLVVEVAATSLTDDLGDKAMSYARAGLPEYIVADVEARALHHMWGPGEAGYAHRDIVRFGETLALKTMVGLVVQTDRLV